VVVQRLRQRKIPSKLTNDNDSNHRPCGVYIVGAFQRTNLCLTYDNVGDIDTSITRSWWPRVLQWVNAGRGQGMIKLSDQHVLVRIGVVSM
jgi:hypothetical protein